MNADVQSVPHARAGAARAAAANPCVAASLAADGFFTFLFTGPRRRART